MGDFISEDDLRTFEGWLSKYQGYNPAALKPNELTLKSQLGIGPGVLFRDSSDPSY